MSQNSDNSLFKIPGFKQPDLKEQKNKIPPTQTLKSSQKTEEKSIYAQILEIGEAIINAREEAAESLIAQNK